MPIDFKEIQDHGEYVTGIAPYNDPDGQGNFNLRVSGPRDAVESFAKTATIVRIKLEPLESANLEWLYQTDARAAQERRKYILENPQAVWETQKAQDRDDAQARPLKLSVDRFIEIEHLDPLEKEQVYFVSFYFDPETVAQGQRDVWSAPGQMISRGGFPSHSYLWDGVWRGVVTVFRGVAVYDYYGAYLMGNGERVG